MEEKFSITDIRYMARALEIAKKGEGSASPNPMVGAVLVKNGEIIGEGYHKFYGGPHAEVYALKEAGQNANNADIYLTLEPCSHYGKTPPCADKLIKSGIKRAVIAMVDPNPEVSGRGIELLKEAGIEVELGLMAEKAKDLNEVFLKYITSDYPYVYLKKAQTLDGFIASSTGHSKWITNEKARLEGHKLRHKVDAIMVGIGTVLADDPSLTTRLEEQGGIDSLRVILDPELDMPLDAKIINQESTASTLLIASEASLESNSAALMEKKEKLLAKNNVDIIAVPLEEEGFLNLDFILRQLHDLNISSILLEGGAKLSYSFLNKGLIDKFYYFIAPKIYGGDDGISSFCGQGPKLMSDSKDIKILDRRFLGDNILLIGELQNK
ncbi:bifunctional diaminohydroxyphosphoribosylaminopyrimidine deaminase/5-amino-6-(5-phosphoribosylamino)uracil reductase RibD [Halanaerobium hydrogeniformans]|uniref:Riboflavin biosynthesis protein RibD n=1 Tax=Halanaerobium hydrogeniformans TaxID=656519 RepID=E4RMQ1_HALHG|nr:bifunctional diaminohydroxyphosphoribosylaminopyrimidine deaminase/5-amino-6-(5-phosphoribosylamino)uracil reductase RibD [Halanaerobium hydrogeniformans]ADQ14582.1 riboflavin biosynthesis protein RibD [Halanaerobium hydrogeniformans]